MTGFILTCCVFFSGLAIPVVYFWLTREEAGRYGREMIVGLVLQILASIGVCLAAGRSMESGEKYWQWTFLYLLHVNFWAVVYFATMPVWTRFYKRPPRTP